MLCPLGVKFRYHERGKRLSNRAKSSPELVRTSDPGFLLDSLCVRNAGKSEDNTTGDPVGSDRI
jgi:hypothetical protein